MLVQATVRLEDIPLDELEREIRRRRAVDAQIAASYSSAQIIALVAGAYGVRSCEIMSKRRGSEIIAARHAAVWMLRTTKGLSYPSIGRAMGIDHTTAQNACRRVLDMMDRADEKIMPAMELLGKLKEYRAGEPA